MTTVLISIIIITSLIGVAVYLMASNEKAKTSRTTHTASGICLSAIGQTQRKRQNKQELIEILSVTGSASNLELREQIGVSRQTVARYMNEMEASGLIEQISETGRGVRYRLK